MKLVIEQVIHGVKYDTEAPGVTLVAGDDYIAPNGRTDRNGRNTLMYKTRKGSFFLVKQYEANGGVNGHIQPINERKAQHYWDVLTNQRVSFEKVFPHAKVVAA